MSEMNLIQWMMGMLAIVFLYFLYLLQRDRETCRWTYHECGDYWDTECGTSYQFFCDGPAENHHRFCQYCGRQIVEVEDE